MFAVTRINPVPRLVARPHDQDEEEPRRWRAIDTSDLMEGRVRDGLAGRMVFFRGERPESD